MFARLRLLREDLGWINAALFVAARIAGRCSGGRLKLRKYYLTAQPVASGDLTPARRGRAIAVHEASATEIQLTDLGRPAAAVEHRLRHGARCLLAHKDDALLGFQWFTTRDFPEDEVRCRYRLDPRDRCAWDFDIYVQPAARTLPVFLRLWDHCHALLRDAGIDLSLSRIDAFNSASLRSHARLGAKPVAWALFLTLGPAQLAVFSSRPWFHVSWSGTPTWPVSHIARGGNRTHVAESPQSSP
jgi:GNAT superfamily N-acetyltransferase